MCYYDPPPIGTTDVLLSGCQKLPQPILLYSILKVIVQDVASENVRGLNDIRLKSCKETKRSVSSGTSVRYLEKGF